MSIIKGVRVFIVEDDLTLLEYLHDILEDCGITTRAYVRAKEALADAIEEKPAVVMTDLSLRDINGTDLAVRLVQNDPNVHVIIMTGFSGEKLTNHAELEGLDKQVEFVIKPFDINMIIKRLYNILGD